MITSLKEINEHVTKKTHEKNDLVHTLKDKTQTLNERRKITKKIMRMSELELDQYFHMKFFDQVKDQMQTGDVCLCAGQEFFSKLIKKSTMCCFSHVMVVIKDPSPAVRKAYNIPNDETERVFIFESDSSTVDGRKGGGVQLITVKQAIQLGMDYYKTKDYLFVWRRLNGYKMTKEKEIALEQFMLRLCGKPYETHKMELAKAVLSLNKNEDYESVFCSELVAGTLKVTVGYEF